MKPEYIGWTGTNRKRATTRLKPKCLGKYALICGSYYKPVKSGCEIDIYGRLEWTFAAPAWFRQRIARDEGFKTWAEFLDVLMKINADKVKKGYIDDKTVWYTHYYHVLVPPKEWGSVGPEVE